MSTRTNLFSVTSMEPIRASVASKDRDLIDAILARRRSELRERYSEDEIDADTPYDTLSFYLENMIACDSPPQVELGAWNRVIELLAAHHGLTTNEVLPFNEGWGHYETWKTYRRFVAEHVTSDSDRSLAYLQDGRPLRGSSVEHDGCVFSWLKPPEVDELYRSLSPLDESLMSDPDYAYIHEDLVASLKRILERGGWLFLAAD